MTLANLKYVLILFILPALVMARDLKGKYKKEKSINKSYAVNSNALLDISNKYGNIFVTTWDQNVTEIDVFIRVAGDNNKQVNERFNTIDIAFSATKAIVAAATKVGNLPSCSSNMSMEINYTIKIPKNGLIKLYNQYGGIKTGKIYGKADIKCQYGDVYLDELNADNNVVKIEYCGSMRANFIKSASVNAQYSHFSCGRAISLNIKGQYSAIFTTDVKDLNYKSEYGEVNLNSAGKVTGKSEYSSIKIGRITGLLNLTADYGDIKVDMFDKSTRNIAINSSYTGVSLGFDNDYPFDFEIYTEYAGVDGTNGFKYSLKSDKNNEKQYKGYYKAPSINKVFIKSEYGHVNLNRR